MVRKVLKLGLLAATAALVACGGGGAGVAPSAVSPVAQSSVVHGTVTGFDGIIVDDIDYPSAGAAVVLDIDPRVETPASMADVQLGQQVELALDGAGRATKIFVRATVIGPVESVDVAGNSFKVVGQTVKVITDGAGKTVFAGVDGLAGLAIAAWVEVHGTLDADRNIVATRVEVKPAAGTIKVRAGGLVKDHDAVAKTFKLGELTVNYTDAVIKPDGATIANDVLVFVFSDQLPVAGTLTARAVRVAHPLTIDGRRLTVGGLVTDAAADGKTFRVNGIAVDAAAAELKGGQNPTFADIKDMALVRVEGTLASTPAGVVLNATRVWIIPASERRRVVLSGQITDYVSAASFRVRGVPINADEARFRGGVKDDLKDGAFVMVKGRIDGALVKADEVDFRAPPRDVDFRLTGVVSDYDAAAGTFKLLGIPMQLATGATFDGGTLADLANGALVEVRGSFNGSVFMVVRVVFKPASLPLLIHIEGVISNVSATGFTLNGTEIRIDADTVIKNGPLANGQRVEVKAQLVGTDIVAREVEVQIPGATAMLMGPLSGLDTVAKTFVVQGQTVAYSSSTEFRGGGEADLANGRIVRVNGALSAGVVNAATIQFIGR